MPTGLHLKYPGISGQLQVLLSAVARAMFYEVEYTLDPVNGPWTAVPAFGSTRGIVLTGLTRGKDYYVRVRAVASGRFAARGATSRPRWRCRERNTKRVKISLPSSQLVPKYWNLGKKQTYLRRTRFDATVPKYVSAVKLENEGESVLASKKVLDRSAVETDTRPSNI